jgi:hypothetical protein
MVPVPRTGMYEPAKQAGVSESNEGSAYDQRGMYFLGSPNVLGEARIEQ